MKQIYLKTYLCRGERGLPWSVITWRAEYSFCCPKLQSLTPFKMLLEGLEMVVKTRSIGLHLCIS